MPIEKKGKIINTPSSGSTDDNAVVRWDGTSSNSLQNSEIQIDDTGNIYPNTNNAQDLGISGTNEFKDLYLSGNAIIGGDLTVQGNSTTVNTATLDVEDVNITVNKNGNDASSEGAGLTVERTSTNGSIVYEDALTSKWKCGAEGAEAEILNKNNDTDDLQEGSTNLYFTEERAQDSVGSILVDSSTIDFTYDDGTPSITADVIASAIEHGDLAGLGDDDHPQYYQVVGRSGEDLTITAANIYWDGDGSGNIGTQGGPGRPDAIHAVSVMSVGNATTRMEVGVVYVNETVVVDGGAEQVYGTNSLTLEAQSGDLNLSASGNAVVNDMDLIFSSDGGANIGASGNNRPNEVYVLSNINLDSLTASQPVVTDASKNLISQSYSTLGSNLDHGDLQGLADDDHTQYFMSVGRAAENLQITGADLQWDTDGSGNIGALGSNRPDQVYAVSKFSLGNDTTRMEPDYLYISEKVVIDGNAEAVQGTTTLTLESQGGDLTLVSSGIVVCDDNLQLNAQVYSPINALTPGANISTDCNEGNVHSVTLDQNSTLDDPSNLQAGATYTWIITQDSTPRTLSFGSAFKFPGGVAPIISVGSGAVDIISGVSDGTNVYVVAQQDFQ